MWRFFRYDLIFEYFDRPALAAPLIIFTHIFRMFVYLRGKAVGIKTESDFGKHCPYIIILCFSNDPHTFSHTFSFPFFGVEQLLDVNEDAKLTAFEKAGIENYLHRNLIIAKNQIDVKVAATGERYLCRCRLICRIYIILSLILHMIHRPELLILYFHFFFSQFAGSKRLLKTWIA